jgi:tetratricopeptide (TPR) repeat protein
VADDIQRWSDELARDPGSKVFVPLADALRRCGQIDLARKVVTRGLERHPRDGDAHDVMARIWVDRGETQRAIEEWQIALQCSPRHAGALKGLAFAHFQEGRLSDAERLLVEAVAADPDDASTRMAVVRVRAALGKPDANESLAPEALPSASAHGVGEPTRVNPPTQAVVGDAPEASPPASELGTALAVDASGVAPAGLLSDLVADVTAASGIAGAGELAQEIIDDGAETHMASASSANGSVAPVAAAAAVTDLGGAPFNSTESARQLFADFIGNGEQTALLLDGQGLVVAGTYFLADGRDVAEDVGAALTGVSDEAHRAMRHLELGAWTSITFETDATTVTMGPLRAAGAPEDGIALVAAARSVPLGFVRRLLNRVTERGATWLGVGDNGAGAATGQGDGA